MNSETVKPKKQYVLPDDLQITSVRDLPESVHNMLDASQGEFVISRKYSRNPSKAVNIKVVDFLREFEQPSTVIEAVLRAVKINGENPESFLEKIFPVIKLLINAELLLPSDSIFTKIKPRYKVGDMINQFKIVKTIQVYEESEVHKVVNQDEKEFMLKIARNHDDKKINKVLENEIKILKCLDGKVNPILEKEGYFENRLHLVTKWFEGIPSIQKTQKYFGDRKILASICYKIVKVYSHIHRQGVIHSDVHPSNILINEENKVMIVDYGHSTKRDLEMDACERAGVAYFYEPELAYSKRNNTPNPVANEKSEQYALATVLYFLITGKHYLNFSLEKKEMLRQIEKENMVSLEQNGLDSWPEMDAVLSRALKKEPQERFNSLSEFMESLKKVRDSICNKSKVISKEKNNPLSNLIDNISNFENKIPDELKKAPTCSVAFGMGGIAYTLYRLSCIRNDPKLLFAADLWINRALQNSKKHEAFYNKDFGLTPSSLGPESLYYGLSGLYCVQALISRAMNDSTTLENAIQNYVKIIHDSKPSNIDLNTGKAGLLLGCSLILDSDPDNKVVIVYGNKLFEEIWKEIEKTEFLSLTKQQSPQILGIAHGFAGIIYSLICWRLSIKQPIDDKIKQYLDRLLALAKETENDVKWPCVVTPQIARTHDKNTKYVPWWCSGTAGFVHLFSLGYDVFKDERYIEIIKKAAQNAYDENFGIGDLCCGYAGRAYSFLNVYKHTQEKKWLVTAKEFAKKSITLNTLSAKRNYSLYKGMLGSVLLLEDINLPEKSCMPLFEKM